MTTLESIRLHPELKDLFKDAESRFLKEEELEVYLLEIEDAEALATASQDVKKIINQVVKKVITRIYEIYPYEQKHDLAMAKCVRDVRYVIAYATLSMLMRDPDWFRDKLLIWMKTIIQSFGYPDIEPNTSERYFSDPEILSHIEGLKPHQKSIYETYMGILKEMESNLSEESFQEIKPYLELAVEILAHD